MQGECSVFRPFLSAAHFLFTSAINSKCWAMRAAQRHNCVCATPPWQQQIICLLNIPISQQKRNSLSLISINDDMFLPFLVFQWFPVYWYSCTGVNVHVKGKCLLYSWVNGCWRYYHRSLGKYELKRFCNRKPDSKTISNIQTIDNVSRLLHLKLWRQMYLLMCFDIFQLLWMFLLSLSGS